MTGCRRRQTCSGIIEGATETPLAGVYRMIRNGLGLKAPNGDDNAADPQYRFLAARPHARWALRRQANEDQRHRPEFWNLEGALDEGRQRSQSKWLSRNSARP